MLKDIEKKVNWQELWDPKEQIIVLPWVLFLLNMSQTENYSEWQPENSNGYKKKKRKKSLKKACYLSSQRTRKETV